MEVYETLPIVPLRDVVVFPHMMMPFVIGRPSSTRALEHALAKDKKIFLAAQHDASIDDPRPEDIFTMGCVANVVQSLKLPDGNIKVLVEGVDRARAIEWKEDKGFYRVVVKVLPKHKDATGDVEGDDEPRRVAVRAVREAVEQPALRRDDRRRPRGRPGQARRHDCRAPAGRRRREAEPARDRLAARAPEPHRQHPRSRGGQAPGRSPHPVSREEADGEGAEGVLPQREDEGDPEGTGPQGREGQRDRRSEEEDRAVEDAQGRRGEGGPGAQAPGVDAADVGRGHRLAQLPRLAHRGAVAQEEQGEPRPHPRRSGAQRRPPRAGEDQGPHPRVPRRAGAGEEAQGDDPDAGGPSGRRQDVAGQVHRARDEPQVRAAVAGRRARRGRDPRPSPHLHRRLPRPDHPDDEEGRDDEPGVPARRSRQDVDGLPRRPVGGAAGSARSGAEQHVPRSLPRRRVRPVARDVHLHGQRAAHDSAGAARPHGSAAAGRLHRAGEGRDRQEVPGAEGRRGRRASPRRTSPSPTRPCRPSSSATRAKPASATSSARSRRSAARSPARSSSQGIGVRRGVRPREGHRVPRRAALSLDRGRADQRDRHRDGPGVDRGGRRDCW